MRPRRTILITTLLCLTVSIVAPDHQASCETPSSEIIDFIRAENADTISFKEKVAFISASGEEITTSLGTYRVQSVGPSALRLVPFENTDAYVIKAQSTHHDEDISFPVALLAVDDEYLVHVVLLLPGRKGLEAVGSTPRGRHRGSPEPTGTERRRIIGQVVGERQQSESVKLRRARKNPCTGTIRAWRT